MSTINFKIIYVVHITYVFTSVFLLDSAILEGLMSEFSKVNIINDLVENIIFVNFFHNPLMIMSLF